MKIRRRWRIAILSAGLTAAIFIYLIEPRNYRAHSCPKASGSGPVVTISFDPKWATDSDYIKGCYKAECETFPYNYEQDAAQREGAREALSSGKVDLQLFNAVPGGGTFSIRFMFIKGRVVVHEATKNVYLDTVKQPLDCPASHNGSVAL